ncbi:3-deoxy-7-phosphoheptulonate synthase [Microbulbifer rhizosphaerae]|uniref:Phospho-2-dehydro-3-deoxyheptonate aldolase n=1 Tax=Microbulbifer rhizosphaerae TaxID=1562603 RepID=A0A7W4W9P8_9GAMM|nr:3-deoxy-7-phosphoheptulonate synthase [Microbulbifer rhizosphaerae]MBB3060287.1 3-deoxy-7-phosphoheptulonate synthase [Microbulbifer rhizosphaerae]
MSVSLKARNGANVFREDRIVSPAQLRAIYPAGREAGEFLARSRDTVRRIIQRKDPRLLVISGPCSIHDMKSAQEYACRLKELHEKHKDSLFILMRTYFEKPRTTVGWKGFINDPGLDNSFEIEKGLCRARELLLFFAELELPCATEALDPIVSQYLGDLISWVAVGARTTESQIHREMASGLSVPVGFKNGTDGNIQIAANAMKSASSPHKFLRADENGHISVTSSRGNVDAHLILRGGRQPNYTDHYIREAERILAVSGVNRSIVVDCSHGNAGGNYKCQLDVAENIGKQVREGGRSLAGIMLESHLSEGRQSIDGLKNGGLRYGVSITDACISWEDTQLAIHSFSEDVSAVLESQYAPAELAEVV